MPILPIGIQLQTFTRLPSLFPPKPHWTPDNDMPDQTGRVVIVTGGNTGIGYETCKALLKRNAKVYIAGRSAPKVEEAIAKLKDETGKEAHLLQLDLADLTTIRKAVEEFKSKERELHILFNNAGVMAPPANALTAQGFDLQFGTNVLGHFVLTKLLLPELLGATPTGRVINTSSSVHLFAPRGGIDFSTLKGPKTGSIIARWGWYGQSKICNIMFSLELARRYADKGLVSIALDPGNIRSELLRHHSWFMRAMIGLVLYPTPYGAITQLYAGTAADAVTKNGKFLIPWARESKCRDDARDVETGARLWEWCEDAVKDF